MQETLTTTKDWAAIHFFSCIHKGIVNQTKKFNVVFELPCEWYYYSSILGIATPSPSPPPSSTVPPGSQLVLHTQDVNATSFLLIFNDEFLSTYSNVITGATFSYYYDRLISPYGTAVKSNIKIVVRVEIPPSYFFPSVTDEQFAAKLQEQEFAKLRSMEQMEQYDAQLARFLQDVEDGKSNVIPPPPSTPHPSRPSQTIINVDDIDDEDEQNTDNLESNEDGYRETTCYFSEHPGDVVIVYKKRKRDSIQQPSVKRQKRTAVQPTPPSPSTEMDNWLLLDTPTACKGAKCNSYCESD